MYDLTDLYEREEKEIYAKRDTLTVLGDLGASTTTQRALTTSYVLVPMTLEPEM